MELGEWASEAEIRKLVMLYCRGCDRRDFALVRSLYLDEAVDDHGGMFLGGPDAFVKWLPEAMAPWELTIHSITNSVIMVSGDRAEGEHYVRAWHRGFGPDRREYIVHGRYLDRYALTTQGWRFAHRSLVFDHGIVRPIDEEGLRELAGAVPPGCSDQGDPSFGLPLLARAGPCASGTK